MSEFYKMNGMSRETLDTAGNPQLHLSQEHKLSELTLLEHTKFSLAWKTNIIFYISVEHGISIITGVSYRKSLLFRIQGKEQENSI